MVRQYVSPVRNSARSPSSAPPYGGRTPSTQIPSSSWSLWTAACSTTSRENKCPTPSASPAAGRTTPSMAASAPCSTAMLSTQAPLHVQPKQKRNDRTRNSQIRQCKPMVSPRGRLSPGTAGRHERRTRSGLFRAAGRNEAARHALSNARSRHDSLRESQSSPESSIA